MIIYSKMTGVIYTSAEDAEVWTNGNGEVTIGATRFGDGRKVLTSYGEICGDEGPNPAFDLGPLILDAIFHGLLSGAPAVVISAEGEVEGQGVTTGRWAEGAEPIYSHLIERIRASWRAVRDGSAMATDHIRVLDDDGCDGLMLVVAEDDTGERSRATLCVTSGRIGMALEIAEAYGPIGDYDVAVNELCAAVIPAIIREGSEMLEYLHTAALHITQEEIPS